MLKCDLPYNIEITSNHSVYSVSNILHSIIIVCIDLKVFIVNNLPQGIGG